MVFLPLLFVKLLNSSSTPLHYSFTSPRAAFSSTNNIFFTWRHGNWSDCSALCGGGAQHRVVVCVDDQGKRVSQGLCNQRLRPQPERDCALVSCELFQWTVGNWSQVSQVTGRILRLFIVCLFVCLFQCNTSCGVGAQSRVVHCQHTGNSALMTDDYCSRLPKPETRATCNGTTCPEWVYSPWTEV